MKKKKVTIVVVIIIMVLISACVSAPASEKITSTPEAIASAEIKDNKDFVLNKDASFGDLIFKVSSEWEHSGPEDGIDYYYPGNADEIESLLILSEVEDDFSDTLNTEYMNAIADGMAESFESFEILQDEPVPVFVGANKDIFAYYFDAEIVINGFKYSLKQYVLDVNGKKYGCSMSISEGTDIDFGNTIIAMLDTMEICSIHEVKETEQATETTAETTTEAETETTKADTRFRAKVSGTSKNVKLGEIAKTGNLYVGLKYVESMNYIPGTTSITDEELSDGHELLVAFLEVYNASNKEIKIDASSIQFYTDSVQANDPDTYFYMAADGFRIYDYYDLDPGTEANICVAYDVLEGWDELKVFFDDQTYWKVSKDQVSTDPYINESVFNVENTKDTTAPGDEIYSAEQTIVFDGFQIYNEETYFETNKYAVFKFTVINNGKSELDYSFVGYDATAYHKNHYIGTASYALDDTIEGYTNVYDVGKIMPGMSATIYYAFDMDPVDESGSYYMIYDAGYITPDVKGYVYIQ